MKLVLIVDKEGKIRKGNIVQYTPPTGQATNNIPDNTFYNIFNTAEPTVNGQFRFLSVTGRWLYELNYKDRKMQSYGIIKSDSDNGASRTTKCTNWYLITTYYYSDGSTSQTSQYIGTTCSPGCDDPVNQGFCPDHDGSGFGGGGADVDYEFAVGRDVDWKVADNPESPGTGSGIYSHERIKGKRVANEAYGGHFTGIFHYTSDCGFCSSSNPYDVWWEESVEVKILASTTTALSRVSGMLQYQGRVTHPENTKTWSFSTIF